MVLTGCVLLCAPLSRRSILLRLAPLLAAGACASNPWIEPSSSWVTVETEHFRIHTDVTAREYEQVAARFELTHAALAGTYFRGVEVPRVEAMVFADPEEYEALFGRGNAGVFIPGRGL